MGLGVGTGTVAGLIVSEGVAEALIVPVNWNLTWDCTDTLYGVQEGYGNAGRGEGGGWKIDNVSTVTPGNARFERLFYQTNPYTVATSLAIGPDPSNGNTMTAYLWHYGSNEISKLPQGSTTPQVIGRPPGIPGGRAMFAEAGGGEVNQATGEIYLTGVYSGTITPSGGSARVAIVKPGATGIETVAISGPLLPASQALSTIPGGSGDWNLSSDMAIDGQGNMYMMAAYGGNGPRALIKVIPNRTDVAGDWLYSIVRVFPANSGLQGAPADFWGMAFVNGTI
jgi:hypothetical protein